MTTPLWVAETASVFWSLAGEEEAFPRSLRRPIANAVPLAVVSLPKLRVVGVDAWLRRQGIPCCLGAGDRALRACIVARYGQGLLFVNGADPEDEQRFSLAHELAHFLRDYWRPRHLASERLGREVLEVFDGDRPPRQDERAHALLAHIRIGFHVHLMERDVNGRPTDAAIDLAESNADRLAFELLAPSATVRGEALSYPSDQRQEAVGRLLRHAYGLPAAPAVRYASLLVPSSYNPSSLVRRLGLLL